MSADLCSSSFIFILSLDDLHHGSNPISVAYQNILQAQWIVSSSSIIMRLRSISSMKLCSGSSIILYCFQLSTRWIVAIDWPFATESRKVTYQRFPLPVLIKFPSRSFRFFVSFAYLDERLWVSDPDFPGYKSLLDGALTAPAEFYFKVI